MELLAELLKGVFESCVLEIIGKKESFGYEITRRLHALGFTDMVDGTVYTISWRGRNRGMTGLMSSRCSC